MQKMGKKGQVSNSVWALVGVAVAFVVVILVLVFGNIIVADVQTDVLTGTAGCNATSTTNCGSAYNVTVDGQQALEKVSSKLPLIGTVIIAVIIIGLLVVGFAGFMAGRTRQ